MQDTATPNRSPLELSEAGQVSQWLAAFDLALRACDRVDLTALSQAPVLLRAPLKAAREKMGEEALNIRFDHARKTNPRLSIDEDADIASFIQNTLRQ